VQLCLLGLLNVPALGQANCLVIVSADPGVDRVGAYGVHPAPDRTPVIDRLANRGLLFRDAWTNSMCSTTRATILTGRYSFRTGIGGIVGPGDAFTGLSLDEEALPERAGFRVSRPRGWGRTPGGERSAWCSGGGGLGAGEEQTRVDRGGSPCRVLQSSPAARR